MHGRAITMIELLVLMALLAVLLATMVPTLAKAKEYVIEVTCLDNVHRIMIAQTQYGKDNSDTWPGRGDDSTTDFENKLRAWVPCGTSYDSKFDVRKGALFPYLGTLGVYRCPSDEKPANGQLSYSINSNLYAHSVSRPSPVRAITYPKPSMFSQRGDLLIILVDEGSPNDGNFKPIKPSFAIADEPKWYHRQRSSFGYFDGHVVLCPYNDPAIIQHLSPSWFPNRDNYEVVD